MKIGYVIMAYGYTPPSGSPDNSLTPDISLSESDQQRAEHPSRPSCFGYRSVAGASNNQQYLCNIEGREEVFDSMTALLRDSRLWKTFKDNFPRGNTDVTVDFQSSVAKHTVRENPRLFQLFLEINNIQRIERSAQSENQARVGAVSRREVTELPRPAMYNRDMSDLTLRFKTLSSGTAAEYLKGTRLSRAFRSPKDLSDAGFYFSFSGKDLHCFSCGGTLEAGLVGNERSVLKVHGKFFPQCAYMVGRKGKEYIEALQKTLSGSEKERSVKPLSSYPNLYLSPVTDELRAQESEALRADSAQLIEQASINEQKRYNRNFRGVDVDGYVRALAGKLPDEQIEVFKAFTRRVRRADRQGTKVGGAWLEILQNLTLYPESQIKDVAGEITALIDSIQNRDCQDHTSEVLDRIKTRMYLFGLEQKMSAEGNQMPVSQMFCDLKLLFNEWVKVSY